MAFSKLFRQETLLDIAFPNSLEYIEGMEALSTTSEVMDALGGNVAVAELTASKPKAVWNWRKDNFFPSNTYVVITEALRAIGKTAPDSLWGMKAASEPENAA